MDKYLSTREIATMLSVNIMTVRRWVGKGVLPAIRLERELRIKKADVDKFLGERRVKK